MSDEYGCAWLGRAGAATGKETYDLKMKTVAGLLSCYVAFAGCSEERIETTDPSRPDDDRLQLTGTPDQNRIEGTAGSERLVGLAGHDRLVGGGGGDEFNGGEGPDVMTGGKDSDIYVFGANGGADVVKDPGGDTDRLVFRDAITIDDLIFTEQTVGLKVTVGDTGDSILLIGWGQFDNYIEEFVFSSGVFNASDIEARITGPRRPKVAGTVPTQVARVGERFAFEIPDGVFINRSSGDTLRYRVAMQGGSRLPEWLTFHYANFALFGTPGPEDVGDYPVVVTVTDENYLKASVETVISVRPAK